MMIYHIIVLTLFLVFKSAPLLININAISVYPFSDAICNGVYPLYIIKIQDIISIRLVLMMIYHIVATSTY
jgi:hypothetical protein